MKVITEKELKKEVESGSAVVDLFADGCGNCKMTESILNQIEAERADIKFLKINTDGVDALVEEYDVTTLPTLLFFKNGEMREKIAGLKPKVILAKKIAEHF